MVSRKTKKFYQFRAAVDGFGQELLTAVPAEERKKLRYEQTWSAMFDNIWYGVQYSEKVPTANKHFLLVEVPTKSMAMPFIALMCGSDGSMLDLPLSQGCLAPRCLMHCCWSPSSHHPVLLSVHSSSLDTILAPWRHLTPRTFGGSRTLLMVLLQISVEIGCYIA